MVMVMRKPSIDIEYLTQTLLKLLQIPSPSGYTDRIVHHVVGELEQLGLRCVLSRRGGIRAELKGRASDASCVIVSHLDTLGAMVKSLKPNGRLELARVGHWSSRFAEGSRVTVFTDYHGSRRGTVLPLKASGHTYGEEVDSQPISWHNVEVRPDTICASAEDLAAEGFQVGDFVAFDPQPEVTDTGFVVARHLDDKAGVAAVLAAVKAIRTSELELPVDCHILFTIAEEVGTGASSILHGEAAEMVVVDNATPAPGQNSTEFGVTVAMMDSSGPFDYHLTHRLLDLCEQYEIDYRRDVFRHYRCDAASAVEAGNDLRVALACFGVDGSHGYERTHLRSLQSLAELLALYVQTGPIRQRDREPLGPLSDFPMQPQ